MKNRIAFGLSRLTVSARRKGLRSALTSSVSCSSARTLWTEVEPVGPFWQAEPEHQDYLQRYPGGYTCHFPRPNWKLPRRDPSSKAA